MIPRPLEVTLHKLLTEKSGKSFLLAVSGGLDSMALFYAFGEMAKKLPITFSVAHIHHGEAEKEQLQFRYQARDFVSKTCAKYNVTFYSNENKPQKTLRSEQELRQFRLQELAKIKKISGSDYVVFSHHKEDLLETRILRLIRGTGPEGLVAMQIEKGAVFRPFLQNSKKEMQQYLAQIKGEFLEDPSNSETKYLRNWLRNKWLPALEKKRPGAIGALERSLQLVADLNRTQSWDHCFDENGLLREEFLQLGLADKRRVLGSFLRQQKCDNFGLSHINEMIKRLDVEQKNLTFRLLKKNWRANARHIWCES